MTMPIIRTPLMTIHTSEELLNELTAEEICILKAVATCAPGRIYDAVHVTRIDSGALVLDEHVVSYEDNDGMGSITPTVLCGIWKGAIWHEGHPLFVTRGRYQLRRTRWGKLGGWRIPA